jgi:hypothetical protein
MEFLSGMAIGFGLLIMDPKEAETAHDRQKEESRVVEITRETKHETEVVTADGNKRVCKRVRDTGSRFTTRICKKKKDWAKIKSDSDRFMRDNASAPTIDPNSGSGL